MDAAVAVKNALEEERQREMMDKYFSSYKINPIDSLWNEVCLKFATTVPRLLSVPWSLTVTKCVTLLQIPYANNVQEFRTTDQLTD